MALRVNSIEYILAKLPRAPLHFLPGHALLSLAGQPGSDGLCLLRVRLPGVVCIGARGQELNVVYQLRLAVVRQLQRLLPCLRQTTIGRAVCHRVSLLSLCHDTSSAPSLPFPAECLRSARRASPALGCLAS